LSCRGRRDEWLLKSRALVVTQIDKCLSSGCTASSHGGVVRAICLTCIALLLLLAGCAGAERIAAPPQTPPPAPFHLHLPGISGNRWVDRDLTRGLADGGLRAEIETYDWTTADPGLGSLLSYDRNRSEARKVAGLLVDRYRADPRIRITISSHSGGAAILVWALEDLPSDVMIDSAAMLAPALSPGYDLTGALRHVKKNVYVFYSPYDPVLGWGTELLGTMDGVKTAAAGRVGFVRPPGADPAQYAKLVPIKYDVDWLKLGNAGDHIGWMSRPFARQIVAPLILTGQLPGLKRDKISLPPPPATTPSATQPAPKFGAAGPAPTG
jgi:hypothetical protein